VNFTGIKLYRLATEAFEKLAEDFNTATTAGVELVSHLHASTPYLLWHQAIP